MELKDTIPLSTSADLRFYLMDYKDKKVINSLDTIKNTIYLDKLPNNVDLYENNFENVIYLKNININSILNNVVLKQKDKIYVIQDKKNDLDLLIPIDKDNKIYVYKDYKVLDMLSQEKDIEYMFEDTNVYGNEWEILEVKFNGKKLENYTFNGALKKINIGANILDYQYLNNIQIFMAKRINNVNDVDFIVEHIDHTIFNPNEPMKEVENTYYNFSNIMNSFDYKRGNYDSFEFTEYKNNKATHKRLKNFRSEINIKIRNIGEVESTGNYGSGLYGHGLYGGGNLNLVGILNRQKRFRLVVYDVLNREILIFNNCKANDDYQKTYTDSLNLIEYTINGDKDISFISKVSKNGYTYYELCNI